jgi:hypothetical protein
MFKKLHELFRTAFPLRHCVVRFLDRRLDFLPYPLKLNYGSIERPWYGYCLLHAAKLAQKLAYNRMSAIEFGVAGGNGLLALERHAARVTPIGFIAFDLDYYSSTMSALKVLDAEYKYLLPRVACYFDDIVGDIDLLSRIRRRAAGHQGIQRRARRPQDRAGPRPADLPWRPASAALARAGPCRARLQAPGLQSDDFRS